MFEVHITSLLFTKEELSLKFQFDEQLHITVKPVLNLCPEDILFMLYIRETH
jgi:hypothetical protein